MAHAGAGAVRRQPLEERPVLERVADAERVQRERALRILRAAREHALALARPAHGVDRERGEAREREHEVLDVARRVEVAGAEVQLAHVLEPPEERPDGGLEVHAVAVLDAERAQARQVARVGDEREEVDGAAEPGLDGVPELAADRQVDHEWAEGGRFAEGAIQLLGGRGAGHPGEPE